MSIGLYHDLALATDRFGADLWAQRRFFATGCRVGSPPDDFAPKGQDWGFPPPSSEEHREDGYRLFTESIRKNCRYGGALRIDHVMRFFRLFWIPEGIDATAGAYVRENYDDLIRILALESVRQKVVIDRRGSGNRGAFVRETLDRFGILSYRLFYFEKHADGSFKSLRRVSRARAGLLHHARSADAGGLLDRRGYRSAPPRRHVPRRCHVSPPGGGARRGEAEGAGPAAQPGTVACLFPESGGLVPEMTGELHNAVIGFLALTPSQLLAVNQEDLTKEIAQQNLPATTWQYPNWSRKMKFTLEELRSGPVARDFVAMFRNWLVRTGRVN